MVVLLLDVQLPVPCIRLYLGGGRGRCDVLNVAQARL